MPLIKPRTRGKQLVKHRTRLDRENNETLYAYAQFLGESTEYVLNQVIDTVLARDKEFVQVAGVPSEARIVPARAIARDRPQDIGRAAASAGADAVRRSSRPQRPVDGNDGFMLRKVVEARALVALAMAGGVGAWGLHAYPVSQDDVFLGLIGERAPGVLSVLTYGYATLWFTTPYFAASLVMSLMAIVVYRRAPRARVPATAAVSRSPRQRPTPMLVLGETHLPHAVQDQRRVPSG